MQVHFISGLPRSGSTLLSALLRQNPRFSAAVTSPVCDLLEVVQLKMSGGEFGVFFDDETRAEVLRGIHASYYARKAAALLRDAVVFDTNRTWTRRSDLLAKLYPSARIICCVREVGWIIDSVERLLRKNPLRHSRMFNFQPGGSIYSRVEVLMNSDKGLIGLPWSSLREAWFSEQAKRLIIVPYKNLVQEPKRTMLRLYKELDEPMFEHNFQNVIYDEPDYDDNIGMPGLHTVRQKVEFRERKPCIPPDVFAKYATTHFWESAELNTRGVTII